MRNVAKLAVYAGLGLYDRMRELVDDLVKRGELLQHEGEELLGEAEKQETARLKAIQERVEGALSSAMDRLPKPAMTKDVEALEARITALEARLEEHLKQVTATPTGA